MAAHSSILTWRILETEEPGGLPSVGLQRATECLNNNNTTTTIVHDHMCTLGIVLPALSMILSPDSGSFLTCKLRSAF